MSINWLCGQLRRTSDAAFDDDGKIVSISRPDGVVDVIYSPDSDEYRITADVVKRASELGAEIIAYSSSWCEPTEEGEGYAKQLGLKILPFGALFSRLRKGGVAFR